MSQFWHLALVAQSGHQRLGLSGRWQDVAQAYGDQEPRIYPQMIRLCARFGSVLFTPKISEIPSNGNYSRSTSLFGACLNNFNTHRDYPRGADIVELARQYGRYGYRT